MSSFRRKGRGKRKKRNFYDKRASAVAKKLGHNYKKGDDAKATNTNTNTNSNKLSRKQRLKEKLRTKEIIDEEDSSFGFDRFKTCGQGSKLGWLFNIVCTVIPHTDSGEEQSGLDLYLIEENGCSTFKSTIIFYPYFYIYCAQIHLHDMQQFIKQRFDGLIHDTQICKKTDLTQKNHLSGIQKAYLKLIFLNENDLRQVSKDINKRIKINIHKKNTADVYGDIFANNNNVNFKSVDLMAEIIDIREYDVKYITRACIDLNIRVAKWYDIEPQTELNGCCTVRDRSDIDYRPEIKIFAFDIETEKAPLKFPNADHDRIIMISYMIDTDGYLIVNREIVSQDIEDFEYTPKPELVGVFTIFNEANERALLQRFFEHIRDERPHCYVHYNGDFFDWPFIEKRAFHYGLDISREIGIYKDSKSDVYIGRFVVNIDCYAWVSRDSYLPQGSQNLKAVTRKKLKYNPVELDPELMLPYAYNKPAELATYSVSDAVATYYLFKQYVQDFIFSLCQIVPLTSGHVLRKGTGTLCEALLMVKAYDKNIVAPNKQRDGGLKFHKGHVLDSETYIGGTVEAFESGVFRCDLKYKFKIDGDTIDKLIAAVPDTIKFFIQSEKLKKMSDVDTVSVQETAAAIISQLAALKENDGYFIREPLIYHLDVASMYPNIILTNRLQPVAIVNSEICASCDFNRPGKQCQRFLPWRWRGKYFPSSKGEYNQLRAQIEYESFDAKVINKLSQLNYWQKKQESSKFNFADLTADQQNELLKARIKIYSQKVYRKATVTTEEERESCVCQRENGFYVDTVRSFRDRRYHYKRLKAQWKSKGKKSTSAVDKNNADKYAIMYDSIQLAHKCILNSFYGYVMRRGSRWYNMDMAAITTHIGGQIIRDAHELINNIGIPLELDTDGIWTLLPSGFPEIFKIKLKDSEKHLEMEYPGSMLNIRTHQRFTNTQHHELIDDAKLQYEIREECSIFFEVDGPYRCMILPASTEEGRKLKKRYAVFNHDGSLEELKGFEIKRRGELQMIKIFQEAVFPTFLKGNSLSEVYAAVAAVGKRWLDILDTKAKELTDEDLFDYITENKNMSKALAEYGDSKSTSITCAKRLAAFLGDSVLTGGKLSCKFIISAKPIDSPVSSRAVPVEIFKCERAVMKQYLKKWTKDSNMCDFDIRSILDWAYYRKRIGANIQKIITIPAAMQDIVNPLPNLVHPGWLHKKLAEKNDKFQQRKITQFFNQGKNKPNKSKPAPKQHNRSNTNMMDIEDCASKPTPLSFMSAQRKRNQASKRNPNDTVMLLNHSMLQDSELQDSELQISGMNIDSQSTVNTTLNQSNMNVIEEKVNVDADFDGDFSNWLQQSKALWQQQQDSKSRIKKKKRKRGRQDMGAADDGRNKRRRVSNNNDNNGGADGYFRLQQRLDELYNNSWQIVQIVSVDSAGKFVLWIYVNNRLRRVKLNVKRPFYINVSKIESFPKLQSRGKLVTRNLPRSRLCLDLVQLEMAEDEYQRDQQEISTFLTHPCVEGVYETNVPLIFRIISYLGCCSAVSATTNMQNSHSTLGFDLKELEFRSTAQQSYMQAAKFDMLRLEHNDDETLSRDCIKYIYFYHSCDEIRAIFAFIYQLKREGYNEYQCRIIAVNPNKKHKLANVASSLPKQARELINHYKLNHYDDIEVNVKEVKVKSINKGYAECNKFLNEYKLLLNGPSILLLQTTLNLNDIYSKIPMICDSFPIIPFHFNELDNRYPALQWYQFATQEMLQNWLLIPNQLQQKKQFASYGHIPIGNMPNDIWSFTSDVFFSRLLMDHKYLWWISGGIRPDLGGLEEGENLFDDEHFNPTINNAGAYDTFCVELEINHLATNTVLQSEHIQTLELGIGGMDAAGGDLGIVEKANREDYVKTNIRIDDTSSCLQTFKILKRLVTNWCDDISKKNESQTQYADRLLMEFYRWLRSPSSLFYDPLLHCMVHRLMKKVFMQLIAQFKRFGCKIIYASFDKIIIETGKNRIENVLAYIDSCLNSINKQDLFEWLIINPINFWECLSWYDHANYGGYLLHEKDENEGNVIDMDKFDRELEVRWNIASFLPQFAEDSFDVIFAGYLTDIRNEYRRLLGFGSSDDAEVEHKKKNKNSKREIDASDDEDMDVDMTQNVIKSSDCVDILASELCLQFSKFKQDMIDNQISFKIFEYVKQIQNKTPKDTSNINSSADIFPLRPGSHLKLHDPALEFIKYLCLVLSLDDDIEEQVTILRKNLLRMVSVGNFSECSKFIDPCMTYILPDVNCNKCKQSKDLDLCRDEFTKPLSLHTNNNKNDEEEVDNEWDLKCIGCGALYDKDLVESMLLNVVRRRETSYHVQDVVCKTCGKAKEDDMSEYCKCSGQFKNKISKKEFEKKMEVFYNIAQHYGFIYLNDTVEWITRDSV